MPGLLGRLNGEQLLTSRKFGCTRASSRAGMTSAACSFSTRYVITWTTAASISAGRAVSAPQSTAVAGSHCAAAAWAYSRGARSAHTTSRSAMSNHGDAAPVIVDAHERYAYGFSGRPVTVVKRALPCGDYALEHEGGLVASMERKSLADLVASLTSGKLKFALAELAALPRAALVVEDRYSKVYTLTPVRPALVADGLAEVQVAWPNVPIVFCETRKLAKEWV